MKSWARNRYLCVEQILIKAFNGKEMYQIDIQAPMLLLPHGICTQCAWTLSSGRNIPDQPSPLSQTPLSPFDKVEDTQYSLTFKHLDTYNEKIVGKEKASRQHTNLNMMIELLDYGVVIIIFYRGAHM